VSWPSQHNNNITVFIDDDESMMVWSIHRVLYTFFYYNIMFIVMLWQTDNVCPQKSKYFYLFIYLFFFVRHQTRHSAYTSRVIYCLGIYILCYVILNNLPAYYSTLHKNYSTVTRSLHGLLYDVSKTPVRHVINFHRESTRFSVLPRCVQLGTNIRIILENFSRSWKYSNSQ